MESVLHRLPDLLLDLVFLVAEDGRIAFVNQACAPVLGYAREEMVGRRIHEFIHPDDLARTREEMALVSNGRPGFGFENRYVRKDGRIVHLQWTAYWSPEDKLRIGVARDVSGRKRNEQRQAALLALATAAHQASSPDGIFAAFDGILRGLLPDLAPCTGLDQLRSHLADEAALAPADRDVLQFAADQAASALQRFTLQAELTYAAQYDALTGLPNRRLFQDRLVSALARARRGPSGGAVLFVDLDDFKHVNDQHGHGVGDQLLRQVARRIAACVREADTVARLGGDEFVALLEDVPSWEQAHAVADKIGHAITLPIELDGLCLQASASIGVALYPHHGDTMEQLMRHADQAMYACKAGRKRGGSGRQQPTEDE